MKTDGTDCHGKDRTLMARSRRIGADFEGAVENCTLTGHPTTCGNMPHLRFTDFQGNLDFTVGGQFAAQALQLLDETVQVGDTGDGWRQG